MLLERKEGFTNSERQIADYILKNPTKIQNLTATELGSNSYTSKATVLRLCQKLDLSGYSDLRMTLIKEISEKDRLNQRRNGIYIIRIGGRKSVTLKEMCHEYIVIDDKNHVFNIESIGIYTAMFFSFRCYVLGFNV